MEQRGPGRFAFGASIALAPSSRGDGDWPLMCCFIALYCLPRPPCTALQWFYENKPLQYTKMVNGSSYKRWKLPLPVMSTLYRLAGQVRTAPGSHNCT